MSLEPWGAQWGGVSVDVRERFPGPEDSARRGTALKTGIALPLTGGPWRVKVSAVVLGVTETVYDREAFSSGYLRSDLEADDLNLTFTLRRSKGWPSGRVRILLECFDPAGVDVAG